MPPFLHSTSRTHITADTVLDALDEITSHDARTTTLARDPITGQIIPSPLVRDEVDEMMDELLELTAEELEVLSRRLEWLQQARPKQLPPEHYFVWMLMAGRGSGKTRSGAEDVWWPASQEQQRVAVIGPTLADVRKTCFEGESGLIAVTPKGIVQSYNRSLCEMWLTNGSYFVGYSSEEPERLRGPQHHRAWCDELAAWRYLDDTWDMMMFGLRLGENPSVIVTTTPKPVGLVRRLLRESDTVLSRESTFANSANLPVKVLDKLREKYEGTRLGRQELHAEVLEDNPYALWSTELLDRTRWRPTEERPNPPDLQQVLVAVDPPVTSGEDADECGIVAGGRRRQGQSNHLYVTHDWSCQGMTPQGWAARAVSLYHHCQADAIVAEVNNGGEMVRTIINTIDPSVPVVEVRATRGKVVRAEPVAALYEQNRAHHTGNFTTLEGQMCDFTTDFDKDVMGYSPDRVDALVWLATKLMLDEENVDYGMLRGL